MDGKIFYCQQSHIEISLFVTGKEYKSGMEIRRIKVLLIEDNHNQLVLLKNRLAEVHEFVTFEIKCAERISEALTCTTKEYFDIILCDNSLPDGNTTSSLAKFRDRVKDIPIIIISNNEDQGLAAQLFDMGIAINYLIKDHNSGFLNGQLLVNTILYTIEKKQLLEQVKREVSRRESAFDAKKVTDVTLQETRLRYESILAMVQDIIIETDTKNICTWINRAGVKFFGSGIWGKKLEIFYDIEQTFSSIFSNDDGIYRFENWQQRKDGEKQLLAWKRKEIKDKHDLKVGFLYVAHPIDKNILQVASDLSEVSKLGQILIQMGTITQKELDKALIIKEKGTGKLLGEILEEQDYCSKDELQEALARQQVDKYIRHTLIRSGFISKSKLDECLDEQRKTSESLGAILIKKGYCTSEMLSLALKQREEDNRLGAMMLRSGYISQMQLDKALREQDRTGCLLGEALIRLSFIKPQDLAEALIVQEKIKDYM